MTTIGRRFFSATAIYGVGDLLIKGASVLLVPIYTRFLSPDDYGILASVGVLCAALSHCMSLGINGAVFKFHASASNDEERREFYGTAFYFTVLWSLFISLTLIFAGDALLNMLFKSVRTDPYLQIGVWYSFISVLALIPFAMLQIQERALTFRLLTFASFLLTTGLVIWLVVIRRLGAAGSLYGQLFGGIITTVISLVLIIPHAEFRISRRQLNRIIAFTFPLTVYGVGVLVTNNCGRYLLERFATLSDVGLFNIAHQYAQLPAVALGAVSMAWSPIFFDLAKKEDGRAKIAKFGHYYYCGVVGIGLTVTVYAPEAFRLMTPPHYHAAIDIVPILVTAYLFYPGLWLLFSLQLFVTEKTKHFSWLTLVSGLSMVLFSVLWIRPFGRVGAAWASFMSNFFLLACIGLISTRLYPLAYPAKRMAAATIYALVVGFSALNLSMRNPVLLICLKTILVLSYPTLLFLVGVLEWSTVRSIWRKT